MKTLEEQLKELQTAHQETLQNLYRLEGAVHATKLAIESRDAKAEETVTEEPTTEE